MRARDGAARFSFRCCCCFVVIHRTAAERQARVLPGGNSKNARIATLFRAPVDLIFHGSFDDAKRFAHAEGKWLLVNVQKKARRAFSGRNAPTRLEQ